METLFSFNLKGEKQWQITLGKEWMKSFPGSRSAPTVVDDLLYVGTGLGNLFCVNRADGKIVWSKDLIADFNGALPLPGFGDTHSNTVLYDNGSIYYTAGDGNCGVKLKLSDDGTKITEVWRNKGFDSYMGGIVRIGDYLYGSGTEKPELLAINASTGMLTDSLRVGSGAIISADNMLYYYTQKGDMMILSCDHGKIQKVSSFRIKEGNLQHFSHQVINKGVLYQRHGTALMAFDIHKK